LISDAVDRLGQALQTKREESTATAEKLKQVTKESTATAEQLEQLTKESTATAEKLKQVTNVLRDSVIVCTDVDGDIRNFSAGAEALLGWREEEVLGRPSSMLFEEAAYDELLPELVRSALRERDIRTRSMLQRKDGSVLPAELSVCMLQDARKENVGLLLNARDVGPQARLEEKLRLAEERYRSLVEGLPNGVAVARGRRLIYVNPAFSALCALPVETLVGMPLRDRVASKDAPMVEERVAQLESEPGATDEIACTLVGSDDQNRVEVRLHAISGDYAGSNATLLVVQDETTARRIEHELRRNESQLDAVLEATADGVLAFVEGPEGRLVRSTNRAFLDMFELNWRDVLGISEARVIAAFRERADGAAAVAALLASDERGTSEETIRLRGESPKEIQLSLVPLPGRDGLHLGRVLVCRDLTELRESQRQLQDKAEQLVLSMIMLEKARENLAQANRSMQTHADEMNRSRHKLRKLEELQQKLSGRGAHARSTPRLTPAEPREELALSSESIDELIASIDDLTDTPRVTESVPTGFLLRTLIEQAAAELQNEMENQGVHFTLVMPDSAVEVRADRERILRAFSNLLSNAVRFNKRGGSIQVRLRPADPGHVAVEIEDTGEGLPAAVVDQVFGKGFSVNGAGQLTEGRALGLAIAREILCQQGCRIDPPVESSHGTRICFTLHRVTDSPGSVDDVSADGPSVKQREGSPGPRSALRIIRHDDIVNS